MNYLHISTPIVDAQSNQRLIQTAKIIQNFENPQIKHEKKLKFFKTSKGECYGFTVGGKIYIDTRIAKADTPIHEFTHLWARAFDLIKGTKADYHQGDVAEIQNLFQIQTNCYKTY